MRLKHYLYFGTLACAVLEVVCALYAMFWGDITAQIQAAQFGDPDNEWIVIRNLNIFLPVGVLCLGMLLYTWRVDAIGGFALFFAVMLHVAGLDLNLRAVRKVYGEGTSLEKVTWWVPQSDKSGTQNLSNS